MSLETLKFGNNLILSSYLSDVTTQQNHSSRIVVFAKKTKNNKKQKAQDPKINCNNCFNDKKVFSEHTEQTLSCGI